MAIVQHELRFWFREKFAEKRITQMEFKRLYGVARGTQSALHSDTSEKRVGLETCIKLSKAFNTPLINVLEMAGYAPRSEPNKPEERYLLHAYRHMNARDKQTLIFVAEAMLKPRPDSV